MRRYFPCSRHFQQFLHFCLCAHRATEDPQPIIHAVVRCHRHMEVRTGKAHAYECAEWAEKSNALLVGFFGSDDDEGGVGAYSVG